MAGCIPAYLGADDIAVHIPSNCYVDMRKFTTLDEMDRYIFSMSEVKILKYQENIYKFLSSKASHAFSIEKFIGTILSQIQVKDSL